MLAPPLCPPPTPAAEDPHPGLAALALVRSTDSLLYFEKKMEGREQRGIRQVGITVANNEHTMVSVSCPCLSLNPSKR